MINPRVSVLMPAYNGLPLIRASIESLLRQTIEDWECIIVNDGSIDGTREYLDSLNDSRFIIYHFRENKGRPEARQKTLELASGEYIAMLDAEDLYHPKKLELQLEAFEQHPDVDLVATQMCSFGTKTDILTIRGSNDDLVQSFTGENVPSHATVMLRAKRAKGLKYNKSLKLGQDVDFLRRYMKGIKFLTLPFPLYYYSEYDSVSKKKIKRTYKLNMLKYFKDKEYKNSFVNLLKLIYAIIIYPFIKIETILKKRGRALSAEEEKDFQKYCGSIIKEIVRNANCS